MLSEAPAVGERVMKNGGEMEEICGCGIYTEEEFCAISWPAARREVFN